jgi:hypothetical protein
MEPFAVAIKLLGNRTLLQLTGGVLSVPVPPVWYGDAEL